MHTTGESLLAAFWYKVEQQAPFFRSALEGMHTELGDPSSNMTHFHILECKKLIVERQGEAKNNRPDFIKKAVLEKRSKTNHDN